MLCKYCLKEMEPVINPRPDTPHEAELRCPLCNKFLEWKRKENNKDKRDGKVKVSRIGLDYCQLCLRKKVQLGTRETLTVHHIDEDPHNNEPLNHLVVCDACHKLIHHIRVYHNYHQVDNVNKYHTYEAYKKILNAMDLEPDFYDRLLKGFAEVVGV